MKALAKFGKASDFGTYRLIDIPEPVCGPRDVVIEVKAAAICGADMKHYKVDNGSDEFGSVRGHEFSGDIVEVGAEVTDWKVGQRVVSDNTGHVCGKCPACERGDYLLCSEKVNLGLGYGYSGGFTKYCLVPGEILAIHKRALWEIPEGIDYEEAAVMDPICNAYRAIAQRSSLLPGENVVIFGTGPLGLFSVQVAKLMGAVNIVMVGLAEDVAVRFPVARQLGASATVDASAENVVERCRSLCGGDDSIGLVVDCAGANISLRQAIEMVRNNGEIVRVGMGFAPFGFPINDISMKAVSIIGHMAYDATSWRNALALLQHGRIQVKPMITHRLGLSQWEDGFEAMANKEAIKVILTYDYPE
ncbi:MAG: zinc-binding dehydrogenase [Lachnospiraceae bacterium]|jgi:threonine dehydrogenase-like Zn-dependent dehydrogenase|nr:zinc-binding dehydrogenase [Lachnospiraceae bacterium]